MEAKQLNAAGRRLPVITVGWLRVALAAMVVEYHNGLYKAFFDRLLAPHQLLHTKLIFASDGCLAVVGFFALSGYLVAHILSGRYGTVTVGDFLRFLESRYLRIFPLYFLLFVLFCSFSAGLLDEPPHSFWKYLASGTLLPLGIYDFFQKTGEPLWHLMLPNFWGATWTLPLDFAFYPLGFLLFKNRRCLSMVTALLLAWAIATWIMSPADQGSFLFSEKSWWQDHFYSTAPAMLLPFTMGMQFRLRSTGTTTNWPLIGAALVAVLYACYTPFFMSAFAQYFITVAAFPALISELAKNGQSRLESLLGSFTFSIYLVHQYVGAIIYRNVTHHAITWSILASAITGMLVAVYVEEGLIERIRHRWIKRVRQTEGSALSTPISRRTTWAPLILTGASVAYFLATLH